MSNEFKRFDELILKRYPRIDESKGSVRDELRNLSPREFDELKQTYYKFMEGVYDFDSLSVDSKKSPALAGEIDTIKKSIRQLKRSISSVTMGTHL